MKANRKFKDDGEAVSAVIGVILMVAITVAIAATIYISIYGTTEDETLNTPIILCNVYELDDKLVVSTATEKTSWEDINVSISDGSNIGFYKGAGYVSAGDSIVVVKQCALCTGTVTVKMVHTPTNSLIGEWTVKI